MRQKRLDDAIIHYFFEGTLTDAYRHFGAHLIKDGTKKIIATEFTVYAPNAKAVNIVGDFNQWEGWKHNCEKIHDQGIWRLRIPKNLVWATYKFEIITHQGHILYKADPYALFAEERPQTASKVYDIEGYVWEDQDFLYTKTKTYNQPLAIYEVHVGSWKHQDGRPYAYNELAYPLLEYVKRQGFTHIELMPVYEHPFDGSWGYQGTGYYAATSRYGVPKDLMYLIDRAHQAGIGVIMDWVPGHMCKDAHGLYQFDGSHLYAYDEHWLRENEVWGTANFDLSKGHVQSFFISNALFWMKDFHVDGFRVDAVSNLIFHLGDKRLGENQGAIQFLRSLSKNLFHEDDRVLLMAEDSSDYKGVTAPMSAGGLGFNYKWNMGWMNDTLRYFSKDPIYRKFHHHDITFGLTYVFKEQFVLPFSHDEVVHGKGSLLNKMPGDYWQKFANYRALMGLWITHPGKKLLFMGQEFAHYGEWSEQRELDWELLEFPSHDNAKRYVKDLLQLYKHEPALYTSDHDEKTFSWIDANNESQNIFSFIRYDAHKNTHVIVILNASPIVYHDYEIGVPYMNVYHEILNSDHYHYGGSGQLNVSALTPSNKPSHRFAQSIALTIPPLAIIILRPAL